MRTPSAAPRARGLTLIELMIVLVLLALLMSLAVPSFGSQIARQRLKAAAETLAADLAEARHEAAKRGRPLVVTVSDGPDWCWVVATARGCSCHGNPPCRLKAVGVQDAPGLKLQGRAEFVFDPAGEATPAAVQLTSSRGEPLRVELSRLGRARICAPEGLAGYPRC